MLLVNLTEQYKIPLVLIYLIDMMCNSSVNQDPLKIILSAGLVHDFEPALAELGTINRKGKSISLHILPRDDGTRQQGAPVRVCQNTFMQNVTSKLRVWLSNIHICTAKFDFTKWERANITHIRKIA